MNNCEPKKLYVSWKDVDIFLAKIKEYMDVNHIRVSGVYGIPRGGLVLAVMLSHKLNIPLLSAPYEHCIIIDDICDSGETLLHYVNNSSGEKKYDYLIATMFKKENNLGITPDISAFNKADDWVVFPWEK